MEFSFSEPPVIQHFIELIRACVCTTSIGVSINEDVDGHFRPERGLQQGCSLSPYVFIIYIKDLSSLLCQGENKGVFRGMKLNSSACTVLHLMFADDLMIFGEASAINPDDKTDPRYLLQLVREGDQLSKSSIFYTNNLSNSVKSEFAGIFGVQFMQHDERYLEAPLFTTRKPVSSTSTS